MKIVAGLGSIDEYETFVKAGADEFFCGYVPFSWAEKYGVIHPLNRREVLFYNVQIGSMSELQILKKMVDYYGKPVELTFNSIYYTGEQYPVIAEIITQCMAAGFENFIIADPALMLYLRQQKINCGIHLSGETAEVNRGMLEQMLPFGIRRVIFHRKNSLEDMQSCIKFVNDKKINYKCDMKENIEECRQKRKKVVVLDAPLLFEAGLERICTVTLAVLAPREQRLQRVMARDSITREEAEKRMSAQQQDQYYKDRSDYVLVNQETSGALYYQTRRLLQRLREEHNV